MSFSEAIQASWLPLFAPAGKRQKPKPDAFKDILDKAEILLTHAAKSGVVVPTELAGPILGAQTAYRMDSANDRVRADFYDAYAKLAKQFGEVTATTIRNCSSARTRRTLRFNRLAAMLITALIAAVSVTTFVADSMSAGIVDNIAIGNDDAAKLRAALTPIGSGRTIDPVYAQQDPCSLIGRSPPGSEKITLNVSDIGALQHFAIAIRDLHGRALKLNKLINWFGMVECDPLGACVDKNHVVPPEEEARARTQIEPAILNYSAEVLCKIQTFQTIRHFAENIRADYRAVMGAIAAFALPIAYAWLGAYAFRLRLFAETIRKRTYDPSFADAARMITAVIAGAIVGLFNPAQSVALSPLATAFLVGYGVELFFKFLDTLINAFGSAGAPTKK